MEYVDLFKYTEQFPAEFKAAATFHDFAFSLDASTPGKGRLLQHIAEAYPGTWEKAYQTIKEHGFTGGELALPHARKASDLFAEVSLYEYQTGGRYREQTNYVAAGAAFVSGVSRADGFAYFGRLGAKYEWSPEWLARGEKIRKVSGGIQYLTAAKPTQAVIDAYGPCGAGDWDLATFEAVRRDDGRILIVARSHNGFGNRWLALLDAGETANALLGEHERGEIAAEMARQAEAWKESD
jgi:hypothetical protein